jgi:hypothetical protein
MMNEVLIRFIIRRSGCMPHFQHRRRYSYRAIESAVYYILAERDGMMRSLGRYEDVAEMTTEELRTHIEAKFAQVSAQKK